MWKKITDYLNKNSFLNTFLSFAFTFSVFLLTINKYHKIAIGIFYIPTLIYLMMNYDKLASLIKKWWKIFIGFSGLFFLSRIYAEKALSYQYDIDVEYLNYSSSLYAVFLALCFGIFLVFLFYFIPYKIKSSWWGFLNFFTTRYRKKTQSIEFCFAPFVMIGMFSIILPLSYVADELRDYYIIADAYPISDCGEKHKDIVYIRKNSAECYSIKFAIPPVFNTLEAEK